MGTFIGFLYQPNASSLIPSHHQSVLYLVMVMATALTIAAILSLGRSPGVVPAGRSVRTGGLYFIVRHPSYACYILFDITFISIRFSWFNLLIFCTFCLALYLRAFYEERFLRTDLVYALIPNVFQPIIERVRQYLRKSFGDRTCGSTMPQLVAKTIDTPGGSGVS